ncbi:MAG: IMP dehydrogenase, partial [Chloroflexales bacterium]|nr:IMP dehydrogenase [Chloroflexales bacterium]
MRLRPDTALTFDDVLLVPRRSSVRSRQAVSTHTQLSRRIALSIPVISSNMDTVTESAMARAMAHLGGLGVIHRFMSVDRQAAEITRVKRTEGFIVEHPHSLRPDATVQDARERMAEHMIGGLMVLDAQNEVMGLVTARDLAFERDPGRPVVEVMTPREKLVTVRQGTSLEEARDILHGHRIEKLPVLDQHNQLQGLITAQ